MTGKKRDSNAWTTALYYSVAEYFKIIQAAQIYQSDTWIDFVTGQIKIFRILCYLFHFVHLQCNRPLNTNFTTNWLHGVFTFIIHDPDVLQPHILAILRDLQFWTTCTACIATYYKIIVKVCKGKAITLQAWTGPEGSRRLRLPDFKTVRTWRW